MEKGNSRQDTKELCMMESLPCARGGEVEGNTNLAKETPGQLGGSPQRDTVTDCNGTPYLTAKCSAVPDTMH